MYFLFVFWLIDVTLHHLAQTRSHLEHLQSLNTQQKVHNIFLRKTLIHNMLAMLFDEIVWMIKVYTNTFIFKKKQYLAAICFDKDESNNDAIYIYLYHNARMKLTSKWQIAESFHDCWFIFCKAVWPSNYSTRLMQIY